MLGKKTERDRERERERERESKSKRTSYRKWSSDKVAVEANTHEERSADIEQIQEFYTKATSKTDRSTSKNE